MQDIKEDKSLKYLVNSITKKFGLNIKKIILFGSRARNDYTQDSDYDLLIVFDKVTSNIKNTIDDISGDLLYKFNELYSIFHIDEKEYTQKKYNPLFINIEKEGIFI